MIQQEQIYESMPASISAEQSVLGAILLDKTGFAYNQAVSGLEPSDFSLDSHRRIFSSMIEVFESGSPIDFITLTEQISKNKEIEAVGGVVYVTNLTEGLPRVKNVSQYVKIVKEKAALRHLINIANGTSRAAYEQDSPSSQIIGTLTEQMLSLLGDTANNSGVRVSDFSEETWQRILDRRNSTKELIGFATGVEPLDYRTCGIERKSYWIIGGRPNDGKTPLGLQIAAANASKGEPVLYFSIEMDRHALAERLWSAWARVDYTNIKNPKRMKEVEAMSLAAARADVDSWPLFIEDNDSYSVSELEARTRLWISREKVGLVIVDYLQLVDAPGKDERTRISKVSTVMRRIAKRNDIAVVGLSQMPRPADHNMNKRPTKYDLKESGSLENDAHTVVMIYRPVDEHHEYANLDELITVKQRSGMIGSDPVLFQGKYQTFVPRAQ